MLQLSPVEMHSLLPKHNYGHIVKAEKLEMFGRLTMGGKKCTPLNFGKILFPQGCSLLGGLTIFIFMYCWLCTYITKLVNFPKISPFSPKTAGSWNFSNWFTYKFFQKKTQSLCGWIIWLIRQFWECQFFSQMPRQRKQDPGK